MLLAYQAVLPRQGVSHSQCTPIPNLYPDTPYCVHNSHLLNPGTQFQRHLSSARCEQLVFLHAKLKIELCCENQSSAGWLQAWMLRKTVARHWVTCIRLNMVSCIGKAEDLSAQTWHRGLLSLTSKNQKSFLYNTDKYDEWEYSWTFGTIYWFLPLLGSAASSGSNWNT